MSEKMMLSISRPPRSFFVFGLLFCSMKDSGIQGIKIAENGWQTEESVERSNTNGFEYQSVDSQALERMKNMLDEASIAKSQTETGIEGMEKVDQYMSLSFAENGDAFVNDSHEYLGLDAQQAMDLQAYVNNKWGFLKNIVNINSFFSLSGDAEVKRTWAEVNKPEYVKAPVPKKQDDNSEEEAPKKQLSNAD